SRRVRSDLGVAPSQGLPDLGNERFGGGRVPLLHWLRSVRTASPPARIASPAAGAAPVVKKPLVGREIADTGSTAVMIPWAGSGRSWPGYRPHPHPSCPSVPPPVAARHKIHRCLPPGIP